MTEKSNVTFENCMKQLAEIKGDWWIDALRERRSMVVFAKDTHNPAKPPSYICKLQCAEGGRLTSGLGETPVAAFQDAIANVKKRFNELED